MNSLEKVSELGGVVPFLLSPLRTARQVYTIWNRFLEMKRGSFVLPSILVCSAWRGKGGLIASIIQLSAAFYILSEIWSHQKSVSKWEEERKTLLSSVEQSSKNLRELKETFEEMKKREKALSLEKEEYEQHLKNLQDKINAKVAHYTHICSLIQRLEEGDLLSPEEEGKVEEAWRLREEKSKKKREGELSNMVVESRKKGIRDLFSHNPRSSFLKKKGKATFADGERATEVSGSTIPSTASRKELSLFRKLALGFLTLITND